jgi:hypothetical protein
VGVLWCALTLGAFGAEKAPTWESMTWNDSNSVHTKLRGNGPGGACDAELIFRRSRGATRKPVTKNNATTPPLSIELWLTDVKQVAPFKVDDFEGPDAPAGKLVTVTLTTKGKPRVWKLTPSGWYSPLSPGKGDKDPGSFVFGLGDSLRDYRDLVQMADLLAAGAESFKIEIAAYGKAGTKLSFDVPLGGADAALKQLMAL